MRFLLLKRRAYREGKAEKPPSQRRDIDSCPCERRHVGDARVLRHEALQPAVSGISSGTLHGGLKRAKVTCANIATPSATD